MFWSQLLISIRGCRQWLLWSMDGPWDCHTSWLPMAHHMTDLLVWTLFEQQGKYMRLLATKIFTGPLANISSITKLNWKSQPFCIFRSPSQYTEGDMFHHCIMLTAFYNLYYCYYYKYIVFSYFFIICTFVNIIIILSPFDHTNKRTYYCWAHFSTFKIEHIKIYKAEKTILNSLKSAKSPEPDKI